MNLLVDFFLFICYHKYMKFEKQKDGILVKNSEEFDAQNFLECGQLFRYRKNDDGSYVVLSKNNEAKVYKIGEDWKIETEAVEYFVNFFDLKTDYAKINKRLCDGELMNAAIKFGEGIRLVNNDFLETIFSFVISANNRIVRIKRVVENLCKGAGTKLLSGEFAFPTIKQLNEKDLDFFESLGAGYRGVYLYKLSRELADFDELVFENLSTDEARKLLIKFSGVGPKVADCVLLFSLGRRNVFPVDTWVEKIYHKYFESGIKSRNKMREFLIEKFGDDAGYAQQYLFYAQRMKGDKRII